MESETCVEAPLSGEYNTANGDVSEMPTPAERMIVTNGDLSDEASEALAVNAGPKVYEVSCESDNVTDTGTDKQKYASKLIEDTKGEDDGSVAKSKHYEESAERAKTDKTEDADISSSSRMKFEENENVKKASDGATLSEYDAKFEEEHNQSVSTVEKCGDSVFTRTKQSSKSVSKSCKRVEELDADGNVVNADVGSDSGSALSVGSSGIGADVKVGTLVDLSDECINSANLEEGSGEGKYTRKMESSSKSMRSETSITGGASEEEAMEKFGELLKNSTGSAASIDLGRLGEIKLSTKVSGTDKNKYALDLDFDIPAPSTHVGESEHVVGKSKMADELGFGSHDDETDRCLSGRSAVSSGVSAHTRAETTSEVYSSVSKSSSNQARYGEEDTHSISSLGSGRHRYLDDMEDDYSPKRRQESPGGSRHMPVRDPTDDLIKRILAESRGETYSSSSESSKKKQKIKIDMGDGEIANDDIDSERSFSSFRSAHSSIKEEDESKYSSHGMGDRTVGAERKRTPSESEIEQPSLLERRLGSLGLGKIFQGEESREEQSNYRASYLSEGGSESLSRKYDADYRIDGKPKQPDDFDELDQEINALRSTYKDSTAKKYQALYGEDEEEEPVQQRFIRGRMMQRQHYVEEDDYGYQPYEPEPLPDEDFIPQRSEETEKNVIERSAEIRTVVERQSSVLQKLKEASDSFDELQSEIRNIKQQFIENQARRSMVFEDEEVDPMGGVAQPISAYNPHQPSGPGGYVRRYNEDGSRVGGYDYYKAPASLDSDIRSESLYSARSSFGLATTASRFGSSYEDEGSYSTRSPYSSRRAGYSRSKSLYDNEFDDEEGGGLGAATESRYGQSAESRFGESRFGGEETESKYGRSSFQASYLGGDTGGDDSALSSGYSRYGSGGASSSASSRLSYTSRFKEKPRFGRSNTLSDFNFDRKPLSPSYDTTTSSRFLNKVRERKAAGEEPASPSKREKPFKSRFLSKTFDTDSSSSPSSRFSSRFSSSKSSSYSSSKYDSSATDASSAASATTESNVSESTTAAEE